MMHRNTNVRKNDFQENLAEKQMSMTIFLSTMVRKGTIIIDLSK